jgi:serine/threonine-protein kinase
MAPEQNQGKPCIQSDLYAIGPTIIFLVTGRNPADFLELHGMGYRFNVRNIPAITPHIAQIIDRVTANKISDRYPNAQELANALNN